ncbi:MAG: hypothetical protein ABL951_15755 [Alphaproteobacteria bacterium]
MRTPGLQTDILWLLASTGVCLNVAEIAAAIPRTTTRDVVKAAGGLVSRDMITRRRKGYYVATAGGIKAWRAGAVIRPGPKGPHTGNRADSNSFQARLWRALRILKKGALDDFIALAEPGVLKDPRSTADHYFRALHRCGYLGVMARRRPGTAPTSNGSRVFILIRNTGPRSPRYAKRGKIVRDLNTGETFDIALAEGMPQ